MLADRFNQQVRTISDVSERAEASRPHRNGDQGMKRLITLTILSRAELSTFNVQRSTFNAQRPTSNAQLELLTLPP